MTTRPFKIRFTYFDNRKAYNYPLAPCSTKVAMANYRRIKERLSQENENGVARVELKIGNRIILRDDLKAYPSRWYVWKENDHNFFSRENRPWAVCVPNSPRRFGHYTTEEEAQRIAHERNLDKTNKIV